jgi:DNA-binding HxlR family transcriptional regulator
MSYNRISTLDCKNNPNSDCAVEAALAILGGKWKLKIYKAIRFNKVMRFNEIRNVISDISDKTLTAQLKEMEDDGLLKRQVFGEVPPRVEYSLTELGDSVGQVFAALDAWGKKYIAERNRVTA